MTEFGLSDMWKDDISSSRYSGVCWLPVSESVLRVVREASIKWK
jgi:hypothetical protein